MDMNENITRKKPEETKAKVIYTLNCSVEELPANKGEENYSFKGKVKAEKMDTDLMSTILAKIIKESVPKEAIEEVMNLTAEKLGLVDAENECDCECSKPKAIHVEKHIINKDNKDSFIDFLNKILGE